MPGLDVSFMTSDPMLADVFNVTRRTQVVDVHGRNTPTPAETIFGVTGVVTQQDPAELLKREEEQHVPRRIFIASTFAFRGASKSADGATQYQPDAIRWPVNPDGTDAPGATTYMVQQVFPYSRFGGGTYEVVAESQTAIDVVQ